MMYLPRLCEHCLNPTCVATCPSGSIYKREEDGIVLIDQDKCRGWRMCVSGCPYRRSTSTGSGKAEKCIFCYPGSRPAKPTACSETCVGHPLPRELLLYDADIIRKPPAVRRPRSVPGAAATFSSSNDPKVIEQARIDGIPDLDGCRAQQPGIQDGRRVEGHAATAPRVPHVARWSGYVPPLANHRRRQRRPPRGQWRNHRRQAAAHRSIPGQPADGGDTQPVGARSNACRDACVPTRNTLKGASGGSI